MGGNGKTTIYHRIALAGYCLVNDHINRAAVRTHECVLYINRF